MRGMCTDKIGALSQLGAEKITFPPKPNGHTDRQTDICFYRVALLLKIYILNDQFYLMTFGWHKLLRSYVVELH